MTLTPNSHGIWPNETAEALILPKQAKNWHGCPTANIYLLHTDRGWLQSAGYMCEGFGSMYGLCERFGGVHATREAALAAAISFFTRCTGQTDNSKEWARIQAWIRTMGAPVQMNLFGE